MSDPDKDLRASIAADAAMASTSAEILAALDQSFATCASDLETAGSEVAEVAARMQVAVSAMDDLSASSPEVASIGTSSGSVGEGTLQQLLAGTSLLASSASDLLSAAQEFGTVVESATQATETLRTVSASLDLESGLAAADAAIEALASSATMVEQDFEQGVAQALQSLNSFCDSIRGEAALGDTVTEVASEMANGLREGPLAELEALGESFSGSLDKLVADCEELSATALPDFAAALEPLLESVGEDAIETLSQVWVEGVEEHVDAAEANAERCESMGESLGSDLIASLPTVLNSAHETAGSLMEGSGALLQKHSQFAEQFEGLTELVAAQAERLDEGEGLFSAALADASERVAGAMERDDTVSNALHTAIARSIQLIAEGASSALSAVTNCDQAVREGMQEIVTVRESLTGRVGNLQEAAQAVAQSLTQGHDAVEGTYSRFDQAVAQISLEIEAKGATVANAAKALRQEVGAQHAQAEQQATDQLTRVLDGEIASTLRGRFDDAQARCSGSLTELSDRGMQLANECCTEALQYLEDLKVYCIDEGRSRIETAFEQSLEQAISDVLVIVAEEFAMMLLGSSVSSALAPYIPQMAAVYHAAGAIQWALDNPVGDIIG